MKRFFILSILLIFLVMIRAGASLAKPEIFYVPDHPGRAHMYVGKDWDRASGAFQRLRPPPGIKTSRP
jgi:uncharacterized protein Usg